MPIGILTGRSLFDYFKNRTEVENYLTDYITNEEYELAADSAELKDKINKAIETVEFSDEGYYISVLR